MRARYDEQLSLLNRELITMGALCENAIANSAKALVDGNLSMAESVPELAARIDEKEREIEAMCLKLLLRVENDNRHGEDWKTVRRHRGNRDSGKYQGNR